MIEEHGKIVAVDTDAVWVETVRASTCQSCSARSGCGHRLLDAERTGARARIRALHDPLDVFELGDEVVIGIPEGVLLRGALLVYLLPLALLLLGALLGTGLQSGSAGVVGSDSLAGVMGMAGLLAGFLVNRRYSHRYRNDPRWQPQVLRRHCFFRATDVPEGRHNP